MTGEAVRSLGFFSLPFPPRRDPLISSGPRRRRRSRPECGQEAKAVLLGALPPFGALLPGRLHFSSSLTTSSLPSVPFPPSRRRGLLPRRSDATGQQRVVLLRAQSSPRLSRASLLPSPGSSLSLGCAQRPLVVQSPRSASRAPGKSCPLTSLRVVVCDTPCDLIGRRLGAVENSEFRVAPEESEAQCFPGISSKRL